MNDMVTICLPLTRLFLIQILILLRNVGKAYSLFIWELYLVKRY
jgi:hypothetical protein